MYSEIPSIEFTIQRTEIKPKPDIPCAVCGKFISAHTLAVGRLAPAWVHSANVDWSNFKWRLWALWEVRVARRPVSMRCHDDCIPEGWKAWTFEIAQDMTAFHSPEAEEELTQLIIQELAQENC